MQQHVALKVLHIVGVVFFTLALLFLVIAIGLEEWSLDSGSTSNNPVGHVRVKHVVGMLELEHTCVVC